MRQQPGESKGPSMAGIWAEILFITAIFAAVGGWPVPDVNEAVYLTKEIGRAHV